MLRKLSAMLVFMLATTGANHARADEAADGEEGKASEEAAADSEASAESEPAADDEASADDDESVYDRDGLYAGIGGGAAIEFFQHGSAPATTSSASRRSSCSSKTRRSSMEIPAAFQASTPRPSAPGPTSRAIRRLRGPAPFNPLR